MFSRLSQECDTFGNTGNLTVETVRITPRSQEKNAEYDTDKQNHYTEFDNKALERNISSKLTTERSEMILYI